MNGMEDLFYDVMKAKHIFQNQQIAPDILKRDTIWDILYNQQRSASVKIH